MKVKVALADTFWTSFAKLPKKQNKKVIEFITKFRSGADSSGINYEKIKNACQPNYRSVRIDQAYRGIILKPDTGATYILLWVDHHDDAYDWAMRTKCEIHPSTGALQLYEAVHIDAPAISEPIAATPPAASSTSEVKVEKSTTPLFQLGQEKLLGVGVPESMLEPINSIIEVQQLEAMQNSLPIEAFEALYFYADGVPWQEIWDEYHVAPKVAVDISDIDAALERDVSRRRFKVIEGELELQEMLAAPLEKWRVFLHLTQRRLVERNWNGPVRVLGGAGTGKTVVAMHRVAWLVRNFAQAENNKVLFLTYNTNLAQDIRQNMAKIVSSEELKNVEVINIDAWVSQFLKARKYPNKIVGEQNIEKLWKEVLGALKPVDPDLPDSFFKEEWERIILPNRIIAQTDYLRISRKGRGVALNRRQRADLWPVFDEMRSLMQQQGLRTYQDASLDVCDLIDQQDIKLPYASVVVDETQDMGPEALELIRKIAPEDLNDLFLVGDGHQRIYRKRAVMSHCGIKIVGRSKKLKVNYRTTEQIRRFASALLEGLSIDDLDGDTDQPRGYRSLTRGAKPSINGFASVADEVEFIATTLKSIAAGENFANCCIALRTNSLRDQFQDLLDTHDIPSIVLKTQSDNQNVPGVRLATMHRVKGLEFRYVFLGAIAKGLVPNEYAIGHSSDPVEAREADLSERALLHVASSRAIEHLYVTYFGEPSEYIA